MASSNSRAQLVVSPPGSVGAPILSEILSSHIVDEENTITDADSRRWGSDPSPASIAALVTAWRNISANSPLWPPSFTTYARPSPTGNVYHPTCNRLAAPSHASGPADVISDFIIDVRLRGMGSNKPVWDSTIRIALHGIRHVFEDAGLPFPTDHPQVRMLLKGIGRRDAPPRQQEPVSIALLEAYLRSLDLQDSAEQALLGEGGGLCLDFFFVLRRSKIVATTATSFHWFALKTADVAVIDAEGSLTLDPSRAAAVCIRLEGRRQTKADRRLCAYCRDQDTHSFARCWVHYYSCAPRETCRWQS
ncbi:hypothetical protein PC129_g6134 [Phytophthora cactorum]|uniref:Uncharacterized protein n=1 Tax=Phytophthora cactorum TaxID=29920 RepID=A0A8T1CDZ0_9STRA|nr:hypothetical protein PC114_g8681 [Phytophthora cactorum]KAG2920735.1 hypothetical protein PC117_g16426 [Phytophthora cactorum]KAG3223178.1 hypothetical protein PC129_g6134 [Phytophthora cactorum]